MVIVGVMYGVLVIVNRFNIMLVVVPVVKHVVILMLNSVVAPVLALMAAIFVIIATVGVLVWCRVFVRRVVLTVARLNVVFVSIRRLVNSVLMVMDWLNIMLIIEPVVKHVMILMLNSMVILVLTLGFTVMFIVV